ncbi:MAG: NAD(P)H-binding protein [Salibacteraceae bacterium]|nr:NAD(P)H-binding protein [Salibacteraceae bacterium]
MNKKISILGCGWLGKALATELVKKGYNVNGSTTSPSKSSDLRSNGINPFIVDIEDKNLEISDFLKADVLVIAITSKNLESFKNLIAEIEKSKLRKVVFVSSTSVYPNTNDVVTEATETLSTPLAAIEQLFSSNSSLESTIIRFGGLFGYDRKPGNFFKPGKAIDNPEGFVNFIHRDDCIQIITQVMEQNAWNETFNACSPSHPTRRAFYTKERQKLGKTDITFNEQSENDYKIVSSQKLMNMLNYAFRCKDLISGASE